MSSQIVNRKTISWLRANGSIQIKSPECRLYSVKRFSISFKNETQRLKVLRCWVKSNGWLIKMKLLKWVFSLISVLCELTVCLVCVFGPKMSPVFRVLLIVWRLTWDRFEHNHNEFQRFCLKDGLNTLFHQKV